MSIERINNEFLIKIPASVDMGILQQFLDYVRVKTIASQSTASDDDILQIADDINKNWWVENKHHLVEKGFTNVVNTYELEQLFHSR